MPGSFANPVKLDPWTDIIEVGWGTPGYDIIRVGIGIRSTLTDSNFIDISWGPCTGTGPAPAGYSSPPYDYRDFARTVVDGTTRRYRNDVGFETIPSIIDPSFVENTQTFSALEIWAAATLFWTATGSPTVPLPSHPDLVDWFLPHTGFELEFRFAEIEGLRCYGPNGGSGTLRPYYYAPGGIIPLVTRSQTINPPATIVHDGSTYTIVGVSVAASYENTAAFNARVSRIYGPTSTFVDNGPNDFTWYGRWGTLFFYYLKTGPATP